MKSAFIWYADLDVKRNIEEDMSKTRNFKCGVKGSDVTL
jgi:hypothetical protein